MENLSKEEIRFEMDILVSHVLRTGLAISLLFLVTGLSWRFLSTGHLVFDYTLPHTNLLQFGLDTFRELSAQLYRPRLFINLGIVTLMLTPYLRVLFSLIYFACIEKNLKYVVFTGFVLAVLT